MGREKKSEIEAKIAAHIKGNIGIGIQVSLMPLKSIARSEGKALRVVDERQKND